MAALSAPRSTDHLGDSPVIHLWRVPLKANTKVWAGSQCCIDGGYLAPARTATGLLAAGRAERTYDNSSGAAGAVVGETRQGVFGWNNSAGGDAIAQTDVGKLCYMVDDQTVALTDASGTRSPAGRIMQLEGGLVWVASTEGAIGIYGSSGAVRGALNIAVFLNAIAGAGQVVGAITPGFSGRIIRVQFVVTQPVTTGAKAATLQPRISGVALTGGAVALTSANATPLGAVIQGSAVTGANTFTATDTIDVQASAVTAFVEGSGVLILSLG